MGDASTTNSPAAPGGFTPATAPATPAPVAQTQVSTPAPSTATQPAPASQTQVSTPAATVDSDARKAVAELAELVQNHCRPHEHIDLDSYMRRLGKVRVAMGDASYGTHQLIRNFVEAQRRRDELPDGSSSKVKDAADAQLQSAQDALDASPSATAAYAAIVDSRKRR